MPIARSFAGALAALEGEPPRTLGGLVDVLGSRSAAAMALSGSSDKKSTEYKSAMRRVQRGINYEQGTGKQARRPGGAAIAQLQAAARPRLAAQTRARIAREGLSVPAVSGTVRVSDDERDRSIDYDVELDPDALGGMLAHLDAGDMDAAAAAFGAAYVEEYTGAGGELADIGLIVMEFGSA